MKKIHGEQLLTALPKGSMDETARAAGVGMREYAERLARELPALVDSVSSDGELPPEDEFEQHVG